MFQFKQSTLCPAFRIAAAILFILIPASLACLPKGPTAHSETLRSIPLGDHWTLIARHGPEEPPGLGSVQLTLTKNNARFSPGSPIGYRASFYRDAELIDLRNATPDATRARGPWKVIMVFRTTGSGAYVWEKTLDLVLHEHITSSSADVEPEFKAPTVLEGVLMLPYFSPASKRGS